MYYTEGGSLTSIDLFDDDITDQPDVKLPRLIICRECKIISYIDWAYHMMWLFMNEVCIFPAKDDSGNS